MTRTKPSPLKGRRRVECDHKRMRAPFVMDGDVVQKCHRCREIFVISRKEVKLIEVKNENRSIMNFCF